MKTINVLAMNKLDHGDVKDLASQYGSGSSEKQRKQYRLKIVKTFMKWAKKDMDRWNSQNNEERQIINKQKSLSRALMGFGMFANFFIYQAFLTGLYNYRQREMLNMRRIPFPLKIAMSTLVSGSMCWALYVDSLYDEDLYRIALKYRTEYDESYLEYLEKQKIENQ
jgi:hypothetical protein|tara:strand:+ start:971 stop:1471 length:501 start_codon:yes stop_codon:yes gene_type:complete